MSCQGLNQPSHTEIKGLCGEIARQHTQLFQLSLPRGLGAIFFSWSVVIGSVVLAETAKSLWLYPLVVWVIAARQHSFYVLMHEGVHCRLWSNPRVNEWLSDYLIGFPIFAKTWIYRERHLQHHRYLNTEKDPDLLVGPDWQFPTQKAEFWRRHKKYLFGQGLLDQIWFVKQFSGFHPTHLRAPNGRKGLMDQILFYLLLASVLTLTGSWILFFMYWIIPAITVLPLLTRLRYIAEHYGLRSEHELNSTRNVVCSWWEQFLLVPFHGSLHLDHHLFPSVPFYNLPKLHRYLSQHSLYRENAHNNSSYLSGGPSGLYKDLVLPEVSG